VNKISHLLQTYILSIREINWWLGEFADLHINMDMHIQFSNMKEIVEYFNMAVELY